MQLMQELEEIERHGKKDRKKSKICKKYKQRFARNREEAGVDEQTRAWMDRWTRQRQD